MPAEFIEADLSREFGPLRELLGNTRVRFRHRQTHFASGQKLIDVDPLWTDTRSQRCVPCYCQEPPARRLSPWRKPNVSRAAF